MINLLVVEGEEQVMLRVSVAEVKRTILKQFGINVGALVNSGNFTTAILSNNGLPLTAAALGTLPTPGHWDSGRGRRHAAAVQPRARSALAIRSEIPVSRPHGNRVTRPSPVRCAPWSAMVC